MRGSPPTQALALLTTLIILGLLASRYLDTGTPAGTTEPDHSETFEYNHPVNVDVELVFSSPPLSYALKKPSPVGGEAKVAMRSTSNIENPSHGSAILEAHKHIAVWLDVIWPEDPGEGRHHFVQITMTPESGEEKKYAFFSHSREMNETMEMMIGDALNE